MSYLELYNDQGYDLLDADHSSKNLFDLPKVEIREDEYGQFTLRNLSVHKAETEEDALNLLFIGDTNRVVSETPMNDASTRSHCIFIIQLEAQKNGEDVKKVSKLQLVDLSGSERVSKTGVDGKTLSEAKSINLSLHFLQQVIENLNRKAKGENVHVPYRNTKMTMMLRDSIGGNCKTRMIATIHAKGPHLMESLQTCEFARRVSLIKNDARVNQISDPAIIIGRLKKEVSELKAEICLLKGTEDVEEFLAPEDIDECNLRVENFIKDPDPSASLILSDRLRINQCFYHFKFLLKNLQKKTKGGEGKGIRLDDSEEEKGGEANPVRKTKEVEALKEFVSKLQREVKRRDGEIAILVKHLNKMKGTSNGVPVTQAEEGDDVAEGKKSTLYQMMTNKKDNKELATDSQTHTTLTKTTTQRVEEILEKDPNLTADIHFENDEDLFDKAKAFEKYRRYYRKNEHMEESKALLKEKMIEGKRTGMEAKKAKDEMRRLTARIEELRREKVMKGMVEDGDIMKSEEEDELQTQLANLKSEYQKSYASLRTLKAEIVRLQKMIDRCWKQLQTDFEEWHRTYGKKKIQLTSDPQVQDDMQAFYDARDKIK